MYLLHCKNGIYANISLFLSYSEVTVDIRSSPYPDQTVTAVTQSSPYLDQIVTAVTRIQSVSRSDGGSGPRDDFYSSEHQRRLGHLDEPQRDVKTK